MASKRIQVTQLVIQGPPFQVDFFGVVQLWVTDLTLKDLASATEKQSLGHVVARNYAEPVV